MGRTEYPDEAHGASRREKFEFTAQPLSLLLGSSPRKGTSADQENLVAGKSIEGAAKAFAMSCMGKTSTYHNNCAHYLSDALIRAGYVELGSPHDCVESGGRCAAPHCASVGRRPVRAKNVRCWCDGLSATHSESVKPKSGFYAVYQERPRDGQGHVVLLDSNAWTFYGTGWYEVNHPQDRWLHSYYQWL